MASWYPWIKAFHLIAAMAWMAGMLYLPRLFVYHCAAAPGSTQSETFKVMERRLLRAIMNPAMIATWVLGLWLVWSSEAWMAGWFKAKLVLVLILSAVHGLLALSREETIYYTAAGPHRIRAFSNGRCDPGNTEAVIKELVPFMTRAFQAPPTKLPRRARMSR